ncbi:hypothetical protein Acsp03_62350 [Actinomadura sp. NBRC 104412]|nr:hypothetical protein Acsp03_62350 [Actinomadura sp. NBRC 104412]
MSRVRACGRSPNDSDTVRVAPHGLLGCGEPGGTVAESAPGHDWTVEVEGDPTVKKLLVLAVVALGGFVVWRRLQQDRAELDLWTEATSTDS